MKNLPPYEKGSDGRYRSFTSILQCYTRNLSIRHPLYIHTILTINNPGRFIIMPLCSLSTTAQKHSRVGLHFQSFLCLAQAEGEWSASPLSLSLSLSHTHTHTHTPPYCYPLGGPQIQSEIQWWKHKISVPNEIT